MLRGFTLIELLIVIAIIAIIAGMLLPTLNKARERGKFAVCTDQLKQIGSYSYSYASDHRDFLPMPITAESWINAWRRLISHCKMDLRFLDCPSDITRVATTGALGTGDFHGYPWRVNKAGNYVNQGYLWTSYAGSTYNNGSLYGTEPLWVLGRQKRPSYDTLVFDGDSRNHNNSFFYGLGSPDSPIFYDQRHNGTVNHLFVDGHTKAMTARVYNAEIFPRRSQ